MFIAPLVLVCCCVAYHSCRADQHQVLHMVRVSQRVLRSKVAAQAVPHLHDRVRARMHMGKRDEEWGWGCTSYGVSSSRETLVLRPPTKRVTTRLLHTQ